MGIEPTPSAWKAEVLPLNYTRRGGGGGRIRTYEGISQQIYSLPPLAAWVPLRGHKEPGILLVTDRGVNTKLHRNQSGCPLPEQIHVAMHAQRWDFAQGNA